MQGLRLVEHVSVDVSVYWRVRHTFAVWVIRYIVRLGEEMAPALRPIRVQDEPKQGLGFLLTLLCVSQQHVCLCDRSTARWSHISHPATRWGFASQPPKDWNLFAQYASVYMTPHDLIRIKPGTCRNNVEPLCLWIKQLSLGKQTIESHRGNVTSPLCVNYNMWRQWVGVTNLALT